MYVVMIALTSSQGFIRLDMSEFQEKHEVCTITLC